MGKPWVLRLSRWALSTLPFIRWKTRKEKIAHSCTSILRSERSACCSARRFIEFGGFMCTLRMQLFILFLAGLFTAPTLAQNQQTKQPPPAQVAPKTVPDEVQLF